MMSLTEPTPEEAAAYEASLAAFVHTPIGPLPPAEAADYAAWMANTDTARQSLTDAVQLAALSPYPTPEEQAIIDAQLSGSLALFRALDAPPTDVTALAAAVLTLEVAR